MSVSNENGLAEVEREEDLLGGVKGALEQERDQLLAERAKVTQVRERLDHRIARFNRVIRAIDGETAASTPAKKKKPSPSSGTQIESTGFGISYTAVFQGVDGINALLAAKAEAGEPETFTQKEVYRRLDWDQGRGSALFRYLRHVEFIRKAGREGTLEFWAILDADVMDRVREQYEADRASRGARERVMGDQAYKLVIEYLKEHHEVVGWVTIQRACGLSKATMNRCSERLRSEGRVSVQGEGGSLRHIQWIGED